MTTVLNAVASSHPAPRTLEPAARTPLHAPEIRMALLGLGNVGSAIAELAHLQLDASHRFRIVSALVRDVSRPRRIDVQSIPLTSDALDALQSDPDVVVEVLGGLEPARTIVLAALARGVPVVTANKSLLAAHGNELFEAAAASGAPLLYEASVLAGVPFLGTFGSRPLAQRINAITGIVNGTSNFILSRMYSDRLSFADALQQAQRAGYAEPDPAKDIDGDDAAEKLCVLLRHFGGWSIVPGDIERKGISDVDVEDLRHAAAFDGRIRPVAVAEWDDHAVSTFVGPAFIAGSNALVNIDGVQNAVSLRSQWAGAVLFSGPGAGPSVTAATVLDDVVEACLSRRGIGRHAARPAESRSRVGTGWFLRVSSKDLRDEQDAPALLASLGVRIKRASHLLTQTSTRRQWLLTHPSAAAHVSAALEILSARRRAIAWAIPSIE